MPARLISTLVLILVLAMCAASPAVISAAVDAGDADTRRAQAGHDRLVKSAEAEVASKAKDVERVTKEIADGDARAAKLDKEIERDKAALDEVENAPQHLTDAKTTMDAAEAKMNKEFSAGRNPNGNNNGVGADTPGTGRGGGGASAETTKAFEDAQKEYQRMKRVAADSSTQLVSARQRLTAVEKNRKSIDAKKDELLKRLDQARVELEAAKAKLADVIAAKDEKPSQPATPATPAVLAK